MTIEIVQGFYTIPGGMSEDEAVEIMLKASEHHSFGQMQMRAAYHALLSSGFTSAAVGDGVVESIATMEANGWAMASTEGRRCMKVIRGALPERDNSKTNEQQGLYGKFIVRRSDGSHEQGGKHYGCDYFVLDVTHDQHARAALAAYAESVRKTHPLLADDMVNRYALSAMRPTVQPCPHVYTSPGGTSHCTLAAGESARVRDLCTDQNNCSRCFGSGENHAGIPLNTPQVEPAVKTLVAALEKVQWRCKQAREGGVCGWSHCLASIDRETREALQPYTQGE